MIKGLLVIFLLVVACNAYGETEGPAYCSGMARALKLPDDKVFETFLIINEQWALNRHGNTSEEYLKHVQQAAYMQGLGAGLGLGIINDRGDQAAFKLFMKKCYDNNFETRKQWLAIEYPK